MTTPITDYAADVTRLAASHSSSEHSYYPAIRELLARALRDRSLPFDARVGTTEIRDGGGMDLPDVALYDGGGDFIVVAGEVKLPAVDLVELSRSQDRNDQIGRYLASTRAVIISNVRGFALVTTDPSWYGTGPVPPDARRIEIAVEFWPSVASLTRRDAISENAFEQFCDLVEAAATRYAPIAEPSSLARVLARQARAAKASLPREFSHAVTPLLDDFRAALGIAYSDEDGEEFFRSSLIQTAFYALFAGWVLWAFERRRESFRWEDIGDYLKIRFLAQLFHEFRHPARIHELRLAPYLDAATETLHRVDIERFFSKFPLPNPTEEESIAAPIIYFYEPFLEAFDPNLRKELGVWYTPPEIVRYQVRKVDRVLREELSCPRGLADERVILLDPACGTGAYLLEVMRVIIEQLRREGEEALLAARVIDAFANRIIGFEILTAPFVVAQLQIYLSITRLGPPPDDFRPAVFLTNSLTGWSTRQQLHLTFPELQEEHDSAQRVKNETQIIVMIGNPPYNRFASAPVEEEADLVDHYKGIRRDPKGKQIGQTQLYERWRVRKHLLDDLYIRFFRIAERSVGERAPFGVVSFISNSSFLTGRSHPIMRESLLRHFQRVWVDNLHGNRIASERTPSGASCETIFSMHESTGIKVGTAITTLCKLPGTPSEVFVRDFWGRAEDKRTALLESLNMHTWSADQQRRAAQRDAGPRTYQPSNPSAERAWRFTATASSAAYDEWVSLDELFPTAWQGVNPNRGLQGSVLDVDRGALAARMKRYFDASVPFAALDHDYPELTKNRARYDAKQIRAELLRASMHRDEHIVPYLLFPFDSRYLYYQPDAKLLNERRQELWENRTDNDFLVAVPQARRPSEGLPLLATAMFDLHLHDRGSVGFPAETNIPQNLLSGGETRAANIDPAALRFLANAWGAADPRALVRQLFRYVLAITHAPEYAADNRHHLSHDFAHIPLPRSRDLFAAIVADGSIVATLLNPLTPADHLLDAILREHRAQLGALATTDKRAITADDLRVTRSYYGGAKGAWIPTSEKTIYPSEWGSVTGNLYLNDSVFLRRVPERVWLYEVGGYPVLKKWLGYRQENQRGGPLTLSEASALRDIVQRIAALLRLGDQLNAHYRAAAADSIVATELCQ